MLNICVQYRSIVNRSTHYVTVYSTWAIHVPNVKEYAPGQKHKIYGNIAKIYCIPYKISLRNMQNPHAYWGLYSDILYTTHSQTWKAYTLNSIVPFKIQHCQQNVERERPHSQPVSYKIHVCCIPSETKLQVSYIYALNTAFKSAKNTYVMFPYG